EKDGELENDDQAKVILDEEAESSLNHSGYILEEDFNPTFEVKDLYTVAEKATDIKNLKDIERMIEEEVDREYKKDGGMSFRNIKYEKEQEKLLYRQFDEESDEQNGGAIGNDTAKNGNLIGIYSVEAYKDSDDEKELDNEFTAIIGFSGI